MIYLCNNVYIFSRNSKAVCVNFGHLLLISEPKPLNPIKELSKQSITASNNATIDDINDDDDDKESFHSATDDENDENFVQQIKPVSNNKNLIQSTSRDMVTEASEEVVIEASYMKYQIYLKQIQILFINNMADFKKINETINTSTAEVKNKIEYESAYILTPLDLFFNIHQCVYGDDLRMPALKIFGNLPVIDVSLTNLRLEQIIRLMTSIPFPRGDTRSQNMSFSSECLEDLVDAGGISQETSEQLDANNLSSSELIDSFKVLTKKGASKLGDSLTKKKKSKNAEYLTAENLQQAINFEFSFEINEINFKLKEETAKNFDWILFRISSFGAYIQAKTYDTCVNIYLNKIECEYGLLNDVDGTRLYLIRGCNLNRYIIYL